MVIDETIGPQTRIQIGPRVRAELGRRIRELEARCHHAMTPRDMRELAQLKEFLKVTPIT
jgi:hypothetical protein